MDKVNQKMRKFNLRGVLTGLRSSVTASQKQDAAVEESLKSEHFQISKIICHGFPCQPTCLASDPLQNLLAIGNKSGYVKILGKPGVEWNLRHQSGRAITQLLFIINEGSLISVTADDEVHMWTLKQKKPELVHTLKFQREKISTCHLPFQSKWLYVGTDRGNVQIINLESFSLSGYIINWNKAMELIRLVHPGAVVHLSDNPVDPSKLLIGFETGSVVLWDLKLKAAELRFSCSENLRSVCWHQDGKQFICSHGDGSLTVWNVKQTQKPQSYMMPHAKLGKDGKPEHCRPIYKVDYRSARNSEPFIIFNGGTIQTTQTPSLTVMHGSNMTVLEMEHPVVQFLVLCPTPWNYDFQDPHAIVVLLKNDLVVVDLNSPGYPCFENPYPMDLHESPVTTCSYFSDCPLDLVPAFYSVGCKRNRAGYSEREWPIYGGEGNSFNFSYSELILTGHADGSVKFWDASGTTLHMLYKLKTAKVFDASKSKRSDDDDDDCMFAVQLIRMCVDSRLLCVAGYTHVVLFKFSKQDTAIEYPVLEISIVYEVCDGNITPDTEYPVMFPSRNNHLPHQQGSVGSYSTNGKESVTSVKVRPGTRKWPAGYQPELCCLLNWIEKDPPPPISSLSLNSKFGLLAFGDECGIAVVDIVQKTCLLSMGTPDLYGSLDPYSRAPRSPKLKTIQSTKLSTLDHLSQTTLSEDCRSPTADQNSDKGDNSFCRSHSSSTTSLENVNKESIVQLSFNDVFCRKTDTFTSPCLWLGTSLGTVLVISITLPIDSDQRRREPVIISPSGTIFRLRGSIVTINFLDSSACMVLPASEAWKEAKERSTSFRQSPASKTRLSPTSSIDLNIDKQYAVICSEKQARVISLPSQTCCYKVKVTETSCVAVAEVIPFKDSACLTCYVANGHIAVFSLPSLKPLIDVFYVSNPDVRVAKTLCFSSFGTCTFMPSATEILKVTLSSETCEGLKEGAGELIFACTVPEAPKMSFFKNLFGGSTSVVDREELFGESSGKASKGMTKYTAGPAGLNMEANHACSEIGRAKMAALERGEKLGELEERTERMKMEAEQFSLNAHQLKMKYKDKKWYQF